MTTFSPTKLALALCSASLLSACSGGGSGNTASLAELSADTVNATVASIGEVVSNCSAETSSVVSTASVGTETSALVAGILAVSRTVSNNTSGVVSAQAEVSGNCSVAPGSVSVSSEHSSGTTAYQLDFNYYCVDGPDGETIYNGALAASENGKPSDSGPMVSSLDMEADDLMVQPGGATGNNLLVSMDSKTTYATPYNAFYGPSAAPSSDNPDKTTIKSIVVENETLAETHKIENLELERSGSIASAAVVITGGSYVNPDGERVDISTPEGEPITVNIVTGSFVAGTIDLAGSGDSAAEITSSGSRTLSITVNSEAVDSLNCDNAASTISDTTEILIDELPIY